MMYLDWLLARVELDGPVSDILVAGLYERNFTATVPNDDNRIQDALLLRALYCEEENGRFEEDFPATFLEVLISLSERMEYMLHSPDDYGHARMYFWSMLANIGLYSTTRDAKYIHEKVSMVLDRTYEWNGRGGLFPLEHATDDQREVEIWYQMMAWISEKAD